MIKLKIEKSKQSKSWIIWKEVEEPHALGVYPIYRGRTRAECLKKLKDIKEHKYKTNMKRDVIDKEFIFYGK